MTTALMPEGRQRYYNNDGTRAAGGKLYTYAAGTSAPKVAYQDAAGQVPHPNPIPLDAKGEAVIYWDGAYKVDLKQADGQQVTGYPVDNLKTDPAGLWTIFTTLLANGGAALIGFLQSGAGAVKLTLADLFREWVTPQQFGAKGDGVADDAAAIERALATGKAVDLGDATKTYFLGRTVLRTGKVHLRGKGATLKSDALPLRITDGTGSRVYGFRIQSATTPYTITRNPATWAASAVAQTFEGYMPTSQDTDVWPALAANVKAQFDNFHPGGIKFDVSSAAGGRDVQVWNISGYQVCITLEGYSDSVVRDCDIGGKREGIYFYNALGSSTGAFTLPRGKNNRAANNHVRYAAQCGIVFFGNDGMVVTGNISHDNGESGVKTYQHDPSFSTAVMCTDGLFKANHTYNNYYDGLDLTNVNQVDTPGMYESRHVAVGNRSDFNRHTGMTICGRFFTVSNNNCSFNGSHGINVHGAWASITGNTLNQNCAHPEMHPFQVFDLVIQGDGMASVGNMIYNPAAPSTWNYVHTGEAGADPTASNEGYDIGNRCSHGVARMLIGPTIPTQDTLQVGAGTRNLTGGAVAIFRQGGAGVDLGGGANAGYVRVRGDAIASGKVDFVKNTTDPNGTPGYEGRQLYDFTNNLFRWLTNGGAQSLYFQNTSGFFPSPDNAIPLGASGLRWSQLYAGTSTIATSDERAKAEIGGIDAAVMRAWARVNWCQYKFRDALEEKGDGARWHFGAIAQQVKAAFEAEGLDPFAYGLLCYDEWEDKFSDHPAEYELTGAVDGNGEPVKKLDAQGQPVVLKAAWREMIVAAGNRYGIRYEEALALECAYLRSKLGI